MLIAASLELVVRHVSRSHVPSDVHYALVMLLIKACLIVPLVEMFLQMLVSLFICSHERDTICAFGDLKGRKFIDKETFPIP